jgi:hypothetical protein
MENNHEQRKKAQGEIRNIFLCKKIIRKIPKKNTGQLKK